MPNKKNLSRTSFRLIRMVIIVDIIIFTFYVLSSLRLISSIPYIGIISLAAVPITPLIIDRIIKKSQLK